MTSKGKAKRYTKHSGHFTQPKNPESASDSTTKKKAGVPPASKLISTPKTDSTKIQKSSRSDTSSSKSVVHTPDKTDAIDIHPPTQISTYPSPRPSTETTKPKRNLKNPHAIKKSSTADFVRYGDLKPFLAKVNEYISIIVDNVTQYSNDPWYLLWK